MTLFLLGKGEGVHVPVPSVIEATSQSFITDLLEALASKDNS